MERLWKARGARLHLPRDLDVAYAVGRMGIASAYDLWPLFWGSIHTARAGLRRLVKLGLLRSFARSDLTQPSWYALTADAVAWVAEKSGCDEEELRVVTGLGRTNLRAVRVRNRFWVSLVLACRKADGVRVALFRPEWELRRMKPESVHVVPDAMIVLAKGKGQSGSETATVSMIEFDSGSEPLSVWRAKAKRYGLLHGHALYGARRWKVVALVPSLRRARGIAEAVSRVGAGSFIYLGVIDAFQDAQALDAVLYRASALAANAGVRATESLIDGERIVLARHDQPTDGHVAVGNGEHVHR